MPTSRAETDLSEKGLSELPRQKKRGRDRGLSVYVCVCKVKNAETGWDEVPRGSCFSVSFVGWVFRNSAKALQGLFLPGCQASERACA